MQSRGGLEMSKATKLQESYDSQSNLKPTPLPWHLEKQYKNEYIICDEHNNVICVLRGSFQYRSDEIIGEQERADGEFILKAIEFYKKHKEKK